jgi:mannose-6-phosphate isomerase-like protein (cupin superfamily)
MKTRTFALVTVVSAGLLLTRGSDAAAPAAKGPMKTARVGSSAAQVTPADWGELRAYFEGETYTLRDVLTGTVTLKPGQEPHPPHQHAEEEYLVIVEGTGQWHLDGKDFAAAKGDTIYTEPWVIHGIRNTGTTPLTFVVFKWNAKGVAPRPEPAGAKK